MLKQFVTHKSEPGEVVYLDGIAPSDAVTKTAIASQPTVEKYNALETPDIDDLTDLRTPFKKVTKQRTLCFPTILEWGHSIDDTTKIAEMTDPTNAIFQAGMSTFFTGEDELIIAALAAATVTRGKNSGNTSAISFPAGQKLTLDATNTDNVNTDVFADILEIIRQNYIKAELVVMAVSPWFASTLIKKSGGTITSKDFVDSGRFFATGELPDIYGVRVIVHPLLQTTTVTDEYAYAWTPMGLTYNQFKPLSKRMGEDPSERFELKTYVNEAVGVARVDDKRVIQITVDKTGS